MSIESTNPNFSGVVRFIREQLVEHALPSLAVAVARDGCILWEEGFGWADRENRVPATEHSVYSLASISKPITATGLAILQERGKVDLDGPANDYLGAAKLTTHIGSVDEATLRRIANHTSGLPLHYQFFYTDEKYRRPTTDETIRRYGRLVRAPAERYQYSNLGYGILDYVISRVSGLAFTDFMRKEVFLPLGMMQSSVDIDPKLAAHTAVRYGSDGVSYPFYDFDHPGGSAVFCSAHDLLRFGMFHLNTLLPDQKAVINAQLREAMQVNTSAPSENSGYGIGWGTNSDDLGYCTVSHGGGMGGVNTILLLVPSEKIAVVALANACCSLPFRAAEEILAVLLPPYAEKHAVRRADREKERKHPKKADRRKAFKPGADLRGEWTGTVATYNGDVPIRIWFKADGDVHARLGTQLKALVNDVKFDDNNLRGIMVGDIGTEDANRRPYRLHLDLKLREATLNGSILAITHVEGDQGGAPGRRVGNALSHWAELKRA